MLPSPRMPLAWSCTGVIQTIMERLQEASIVSLGDVSNARLAGLGPR